MLSNLTYNKNEMFFKSSLDQLGASRTRPMEIGFSYKCIQNTRFPLSISHPNKIQHGKHRIIFVYYTQKIFHLYLYVYIKWTTFSFESIFFIPLSFNNMRKHAVNKKFFRNYLLWWWILKKKENLKEKFHNLI